MHRILLLALLLMPLSAFTQTTPFGFYSFRPAAGDTVSYHQVDTSSVSEGASGLNVTWDMMGLRFTSTQETVFFGNATGTPFANVFPSSNLVRRDSSGHFTYFKMDSIGLDILGEVNGNDTLIWTNPKTLARYPFAKDSFWNDSFSRTDSGFRNMTYYTGFTQATGDGFGTLKLPGKTISNVLRINLITDQNTRVVDPNGTVTQTERLLSWHYLTPGAKYPVISLFTLQLATSSIRYGYYSPGAITSSILETGQRAAPLHIYPNPVQNGTTLTARLPEGVKGTLRVYDLQGRILWQEFGSSGNRSLPVNVLPAGYYRMEFRAADGLMQAPFIVR